MSFRKRFSLARRVINRQTRLSRVRETLIAEIQFNLQFQTNNRGVVVVAKPRAESNVVVVGAVCSPEIAFRARFGIFPPTRATVSMQLTSRYTRTRSSTLNPRTAITTTVSLTLPAI